MMIIIIIKFRWKKKERKHGNGPKFAYVEFCAQKQNGPNCYFRKQSEAIVKEQNQKKKWPHGPFGKNQVMAQTGSNSFRKQNVKNKNKKITHLQNFKKHEKLRGNTGICRLIVGLGKIRLAWPVRIAENQAYNAMWHTLICCQK